ncbi:MAG: hypothetical protein QF829_01420 [Candidatus Hydrothermarchaeota archaeon]|jgi:hypothetical protein|nr:hypothetical protein [Candidatus Hydrothermarchaeota archaeon]
MSKVARFGISIEPKLLKKFDEIVEGKGYNNHNLQNRIPERFYIYPL